MVQGEGSSQTGNDCVRYLPSNYCIFIAKVKKISSVLALNSLILDHIPIRQDPENFPVWQKHVQIVMANCYPSFNLKGWLGVTVTVTVLHLSQAN